MLELLALLKTLGFDVAELIQVALNFFVVVSVFVLMFWRYRKTFMEFFINVNKAMESLPEMKRSIQELNDSLQVNTNKLNSEIHSIKNDLNKIKEKL